MTEEENKAIEYYQGKEVSFAIEGNIEELKKALGITDNEEDSFESHQIRIQTLLNLISKQQKESDKKDKVIDLMAEDLYDNKHWYICSSPIAIKEYFYRQVEEEDE